MKGARVAFLNPREYEYLFPVAAYRRSDADFVADLAAVVRAVAQAAGTPVPEGVRPSEVKDAHRALAGALAAGTRRAVMLGTLAQRHPAYSELKTLAAALAALTGASFGLITEGPNAAGAYLAGAVPHREPGGIAAATPGLPARAMLEARLKAYVLFGGVDPANDLGEIGGSLAAADLVVAATSHLTPAVRDVAHVVLPIGSFAESAGTFVSIEGRWQSWPGAARLLGESRPGWKVLRVLANLLSIPGVDYLSSDEIRDALKEACGARVTSAPSGPGAGSASIAGSPAPAGRWVDIPPYQGDALVRASDALAKTKDGRLARDVI
jgi:NADH-quinone oxidoreductase subunit G